MKFSLSGLDIGAQDAAYQRCKFCHAGSEHGKNNICDSEYSGPRMSGVEGPSGID